METIRELYYSKVEKILFYVAGYTYNGENVGEQVEMLIKGAEKLATLIKTDRKNINTFFVTKSRKYKYMRVFYVKTDIVPEGAFSLNKKSGWTMKRWVEA